MAITPAVEETETHCWQQDQRQECRSHKQINVRGVFAFLFSATALLYVMCHRMEVQNATFAEVHSSVTKISASVGEERIRENAINYEKEVNGVAVNSAATDDSAETDQ